MAKLEFPQVDTYFIAWDNERIEIMANGLVLTTQVMETLLSEVDYYTDKEKYNIVLINNNN
jgi:hypothetical protein